MKQVRGLTAAFLGLNLVLGASMTQAGDLGRTDDSNWQRTLLPKLGWISSYAREKPRAGLKWTDDEKRMRNQARHLINPPHSRQWFQTIATKMQRYRITPDTDHLFDANAYYAYLRAMPANSHTARYNKLASDIAADRYLIDPFYAQARRVLAADESREIAIAELPAGNANARLLEGGYEVMPRQYDVAAERRRAENEAIIEWVGRAILFRMESYERALRRLSVDTPDPLAGNVRGQLIALERVFGEATFGQVPHSAENKPARLSRYHPDRMKPAMEEPIPQK